MKRQKLFSMSELGLRVVSAYVKFLEWIDENDLHNDDLVIHYMKLENLMASKSRKLLKNISEQNKVFAGTFHGDEFKKYIDLYEEFEREFTLEYEFAKPFPIYKCEIPPFDRIPVARRECICGKTSEYICSRCSKNYCSDKCKKDDPVHKKRCTLVSKIRNEAIFVRDRKSFLIWSCAYRCSDNKSHFDVIYEAMMKGSSFTTSVITGGRVYHVKFAMNEKGDSFKFLSMGRVP